MKKVNALVLGLAVLLALGCEKEKSPEPVFEQLPSQKFCKPTKMIKGDNIYEFAYNSTGKLIAIKKTLAQSSPYGPIELYDSIVYKNDLLVQVNHYVLKDSVTRYEAYEYDAQNRLSKISYFQRAGMLGPFSQRNASTFTYDAAGKLKERYDTYPNYSTTDPYYKLTYTYLPDNIIKEDRYQIGQFQLYHLSTKEWVIDNKNSPFIHIGFIEHLNSSMLLTKHNVVSWEETYQAIKTSTTTYTYNSEGHPSKAIIIEDGESPLELTYEYNCQ